MPAPLQAKVQALAALFSVFTLLAVPSFLNVVRDSGEANPEAKNTGLYKWFSHIAQEWTGDTGDLTVSDWEKQVRDQIKNCGALCDPEGDLDQDGRTNKFEVENPEEWNPNCNEEEMGNGDVEEGKRICQNKEPIPTTTTPPPIIRKVPLRVDELYNKTLTQSFPDTFVVAGPDDGLGYYNRWEVYWNVTELTPATSTTTYQIRISDANGTAKCCSPDSPNFLETTDSGQQALTDVALPLAGDYGIIVDYPSFEPNGRWDIKVLGIREPYEYEESPGTTAK